MDYRIKGTEQGVAEEHKWIGLSSPLHADSLQFIFKLWREEDATPSLDVFQIHGIS